MTLTAFQQAMKAAAASDLAALQTAEAVFTNPTSTIAQVRAAQTALLAAIQDPNRLDDLRPICQGWDIFLDGIGQQISMATAASQVS